MIVSAIAAMGSNRVIGAQGGLPWDLPEDMKFFREKTAGQIVIMGRKTFESFPGRKPLPGRLHIVITRQSSVAIEIKTRIDELKFQNLLKPKTEVIVVASAQAALLEAEKHLKNYGSEIFVIGGGEIYKELLPQTKRVYLTEIYKEFLGDAYFPEILATEFKETARDKRAGPIAFDFVTYERR